ncbi:hypothetical protein PInf_018284 [Phytophthora infestans]|nr:hypothetical protein PInf_018284 [Phytophthora infestans]
MKLSSTVSTTLLVLAAVGSHLVSGYGYLVQPLAKFINDNIDRTQYSSTIDSNKLFPGGSFNTHPTVNIKSFLEHYKKSKYKSLKAMINDNQVLVSDDATATCGFSSPEKTSYGALNDTIYWGRKDVMTLGFGHPGPCETWCDDKRIQQDMTCMETYNTPSGKDDRHARPDVAGLQRGLELYYVSNHYRYDFSSNTKHRTNGYDTSPYASSYASPYASSYASPYGSSYACPSDCPYDRSYDTKQRAGELCGRFRS